MIKRCFLVVLSVLAVCGCVLSCSRGGKDVDLYELLNTLCEVGGDASTDTSVFYADDHTAKSNERLRVRSSEEFGFLYDGIFAAPVCYERIESYVIRLPLDTSGFEVHIIKCVGISDCAEVEGMLRRRLDRIQNAEIRDYAPDDHEICFAGAMVCTYGRYVFLLSTYDNEAVVKQIKRCL